MPDDFDPYLEWLGIETEQNPPEHYLLLGLEPLETDLRLIQRAASRQMSRLEPYLNGEHSHLYWTVIEDLATARNCLLDPGLKSRYDFRLRGDTVAEAEPEPEPVVAPPARKEERPKPNPAKSKRKPARPSSPVFPIALIVTGFVAIVLGIGTIIVFQNQDPVPNPPASPAPLVGAADLPPGLELTADGGQTDHITTIDDNLNESLTLVKTESVPEPATESDTTPATVGSEILPDISKPVADALAAAREAMAQRDLALAAEHIERSALHATSIDDYGRVDGIRLVLDKLGQFWGAVGQATANLKKDDVLQVQGKDVTVIAVHGETVVLGAQSSEQKSFSIGVSDIEAALAIALASNELRQTGPGAMLAVGTFLALDRQGDAEQARKIWSMAAQQGFPVELLMGEIE